MARSISPPERRHCAKTNVVRALLGSRLRMSDNAFSKCSMAASYRSSSNENCANTIWVWIIASSDDSRNPWALPNAFFALISLPVRMCVRPNHENAQASASGLATVRDK